MLAASLHRVAAYNAGECGICLSVEDASTTSVLSCGHGFCNNCLHMHVFNELCKGRAAWCPTCRREIHEDELAQQCPRAVAEAHVRLESVGPEVPETPHRTWWQRKVDAHRFRKAAREAMLRYCPQCRAMIQKNHGCDNMQCRCGKRFKWSMAMPVAPCHHCHLHERAGYGDFSIWGSSCPGCTLLAKAQLFALRTTVVIGAIPVIAVGVAALPVVAPIAGLCKAVQRRRRLRSLQRHMVHIRSDSDSDFGSFGSLHVSSISLLP